MKKVTKGYIMGIKLTTLFCTIHVLCVQTAAEVKGKEEMEYFRKGSKPSIIYQCVRYKILTD